MRPVKLVSNPPNPFESQYREFLEPPLSVKIQIYEDDTRSILSHNDSPDLAFRWSVNPYRGCFHACAYCYARPSHEYLGFGAGTDFESKLVVKRNAAALLREAFLKPSWMGELVVFSGVTDCYQPVEASLGLTRACLEVCVEFRNPVAIITKGALVLRDLEQRLAPCDHGVRRLDPARVPQRGSPRYTASRFARFGNRCLANRGVDPGDRQSRLLRWADR